MMIGDKFITRKDRRGNFIITHTERPGLFLQIEWDDGLVYSLRKGERKDVDAWPIEIKDTDPGASILQELWETAAEAAESEKLQLTQGIIDYLASTEGNPIRKFCCRQCGECAPKELLEEGKFLDRISWLRDHYKEKHPGMWGKRLPLTVIEDFEPVSPQYRHLVGLVSEPLPKEAD
jgi:hypothetical protein